MIKPHYGKAKVNGIEIYHEIYGTGEPLVLIEGLGYSEWMWYKLIPKLSETYKVIVFDNRGVGNTDKPDSEYTIELMADDTAGLLRTLGITKAHVLGISLGGFIAQEVALRHPDLVRSLILVSTSTGSRNAMHKYSQLWNGYLKMWGFLPGIVEANGKASMPSGIEPYYGMTKEEKIRYGLMSAFTPEYFNDHPEEIDRIVEKRLENPQPTYAWKRQFIAGINFDSSAKVHEIEAPTLVIAGSKDKFVTPENSRELADRLPDSKFVTMEGTGHLLFIERSEELNNLVLSFLDEQSKQKAPHSADKSGRSSWLEKIVKLFINMKDDRDRYTSH